MRWVGTLVLCVLVLFAFDNLNDGTGEDLSHPWIGFAALGACIVIAVGMHYRERP